MAEIPVILKTTHLKVPIDCKRFYLPGTKITAQCPGCKKQVEYDLAHHYFSYPVLNAVNEFSCYCGDCYTSWSVYAKFTFEMKLVQVREIVNPCQHCGMSWASCEEQSSKVCMGQDCCENCAHTGGSRIEEAP